MSDAHYRELFDKLDKFIGDTTTYVTEDRCCENPVIRNDGIMETCINCGSMNPYNEDIIKKSFLNPRYQLSTNIGYNSKYKNINRLHKWINYDYRENMANRNYEEMRGIANKLELDDWVINNACMIYKNIYIDKNISSRNKIKRSLFVYCLFKSCMFYNKDFDIIQTLKDNNLSIENYNKSLLKVEDDDKLFLNSNMMIYYKKMNDNFDTNITLSNIINEYNRVCKIEKKNEWRLNNNSILIGSIYNLLNLEDDKKFYKTFNITKITINKFVKLIN